MLGKKSTAKEVVDFFHANLSGRTCIVTGGNSGIGLETCKVLAYAGARVILCSRSVTGAQQVVEKEFTDTDKKRMVVIKQLDLADLRSVKRCADEIMREEARIDLLILNAGVMATSQQYTAQGFELQIGTNHFGHFYLTQLLLPKLLATSKANSAGTPKPRVVAVSSMAHQIGGLKLSDLHFRHRWYWAWLSYGQSKLANILFTKSLAEKYPEITAACLHPGVIMTNLQRNSWIGKWVGGLMADKTPAQGASTTLYACLAPEMDAQPGAYLSDCKIVKPSSTAENTELRQQLWEITTQQIEQALAASS